MKKTIVLSVFITLFVIFIIAVTVQYVTKGSWKPRPEGMPTAVPSEPGWIDLLSKELRSNWRNIKDDTDIFEIEDNSLHIFGRSLGTLRYVGYTGQIFSDFELHLEFNL